jgi:hypothetical protein
MPINNKSSLIIEIESIINKSIDILADNYIKIVVEVRVLSIVFIRTLI